MKSRIRIKVKSRIRVKTIWIRNTAVADKSRYKCSGSGFFLDVSSVSSLIVAVLEPPV